MFKYKTFENHNYVNFKTLERKNIFNKCEKGLISIFKYIRKLTQIAKRSKNMNDSTQKQIQIVKKINKITTKILVCTYQLSQTGLLIIQIRVRMWCQLPTQYLPQCNLGQPFWKAILKCHCIKVHIFIFKNSSSYVKISIE